MDDLSVRSLTHTRIPTVHGEYRLHLYENNQDNKDHLALVYGDIKTKDNVLVRVHSECFTGDVIGSLRCDCGEQLDASMRLIAEHGSGVLLYLRQEGRGIGLLSKLQAYELQDEGYDTVEANLMLGHGADERDYTIGARILEDLGVQSVRLLTNNPEKIESLEHEGIAVAERVPLNPHLNQHNTDYLQTKVERMRHMLDLGPSNGAQGNRHGSALYALKDRAERHYDETGRPFVTLSFAQSLDGSIAAEPGEPLQISGEESMTFTHQLRGLHDAILVGIGTVLADDPRLTVRYAEGAHPQPIVLDSRLRFPLDATLLKTAGPAPIIATSSEAVANTQEIEWKSVDADIMTLPQNGVEDYLDLRELLQQLGARGIKSLMVEGGAKVITSFLRHRLVDHLAITVAPMLVGGVSPLQQSTKSEAKSLSNNKSYPRLKNINYQWLGTDLILRADPEWEID